MTAGDSLSPGVRQAAVDAWMRGSADSTQMLIAVEAAVRQHDRELALRALRVSSRVDYLGPTDDDPPVKVRR